MLGSRSCRSARGWDLAGNTLGVAGASQMPLWTLLRPRRQPCGRRWCFAEAAVGVAGGSHGPFWASLGRRRGRFDRRWGSQGALLVSFGSRRGRSGRRWGPAEAALDVAEASQETLWVWLGPRRGCSGRCWSLPRIALCVAGASGMFDCNAALYPTSMHALGFNALLQFNAPSWSECFPSFQEFSGWASDLAVSTDARGRHLSVSTWIGSFWWCPMGECPKSTAFQDVVSSRHRAGWLGMG